MGSLEKIRKHDDEGDAYEYVVAQKYTGKYQTRRVLLWVGMVFLVILWFVFGAVTKFWPLLCLIPLSMWVFYYFVHPFTAIEYKYEFVSNSITFSIQYGGRLEKKIFTREIRSFTQICPYSGEYIKNVKDANPAVVYQGVSDISAPDIYYALFTDESGKCAVYYFEATAKALKILRNYNSNTVITNVSR